MKKNIFALLLLTQGLALFAQVELSYYLPTGQACRPKPNITLPSLPLNLLSAIKWASGILPTIGW